MAKKKPVIWYGIRCNTYDMVINEIPVLKETDTRIYLAGEAERAFRRSFIQKRSGYEEWYPTRDEAVAAKLRYLQQKVKSNREEAKRLKARLAEFKAQEGI